MTSGVIMKYFILMCDGMSDGKLSALHSKAYTPINQVDVFDLVEDYLQDFDNYQVLLLSHLIFTLWSMIQLFILKN